MQIKKYLNRIKNPKRLLMILIVLCILAEGIYLLSQRKDSDLTTGLFVKENPLKHEKSPYLQQHKDNPVYWFPWGEKAFNKAIKENKPVLLSIGYATCHWCHVMERESFEDKQVAEILNKHFISIKVDREEHPEIDQIYMTYVQATTGHGGWPLNVFLTPEKNPFFGGTYYPKPQFVNILNTVKKTWTEKGQELQKIALDAKQSLEIQFQVDAKPSKLSDEIFKIAFSQLSQRFDQKHGGFSKKPKFPPTSKLRLLMRMHQRSGHAAALNMVEKTLKHMAYGGIYDHLAGGFHRYTVDEKWHIPHFEKMLYDNALLAVTYFEAFQITKKRFYAQVGQEVLDYTLTQMTGANGAFYSAEDADSLNKNGEKEEGAFYVWQDSELKQILSEAEFNAFKKLYGISTKGNFEHQQNILVLNEKSSWNEKSQPMIQTASQKARAHRNKRKRPLKDDKSITAWNGLMLEAMAKGYQVLGDKRYLSAAQKNAKFIEKYCINRKGRLVRRLRQGDVKNLGVLDDYVYVISGLLALYETDFNAHWLQLAEQLQNIQDETFWDSKDFGYFYASNEKKGLIVRNKLFFDNARPNSNGVSALNLLKLYAYTFEKRYQERAQHIFDLVSTTLKKHPTGMATVLIALDYNLDRAKEIAIITSNPDQEEDIKQFLFQGFLPNQVVAIGKEKSQVKLLQNKPLLKGQTTFYVCENQTCKLPTNNWELAKKQILNLNTYQLD